MIICVCQNISERDIARAVAGGCRSYAALQEQLELGTCCGSCECSARDAIAQHTVASSCTAEVAA